ncbi:hypothetical protein RN001_008337 [Aquatica leii]|uniref:Toll-like receptor 2 n=1 Tax=Aquatica leii TaxID=1421715 RepID=A0AAN7PF11_9COLE|nr:hypothetical protein RN001_008337 [Aquatica leii]
MEDLEKEPLDKIYYRCHKGDDKKECATYELVHKSTYKYFTIRMLLYWHFLSTCFTLIWLCTSTNICPLNCSCTLDSKGRKITSCVEGGMTDSIPVDEMDLGIKVLDINAPENNWNSLTIGPVFQKFKTLEEIRIRRSHLPQIGMHTFWGVPSVKILDLSFNNISVVFDHNFRGLLNLIELHLDDNLIQKVSSGVFKHLTELRILTLERNRLQELVPKMFARLSKLQVLKLSENKLIELLPEAFKDILELRTFECRGCGLSRINTQIYHLLPYLTHLDLGNNTMQFIAYDEFQDLRRIHSIKLDGNMFPVILEKTFINQGELRTLCLARNRLAKITNTAFLNLTKLYELDISYNKLNRVEGVAFQPISESLRKLSVSGNKFSDETLRVIQQTTIKLQHLEVADMGITELSQGLFSDNLRALNLSGNNLTSLEVKALPHQLVDLDISRNKFRGLDEHVVLRLENLNYLSLDNNPWTCDLCNINEIITRLNKSVYFKNSTCASPARLRGRAINLLKREDMSECVESEDFERGDLFIFVEDNLVLLIGGVSLFLFLVACITFVVYSCLQRRVHHIDREQKRNVEREAVFENPSAIFGDKPEISFKFSLDLTERKVSVSTIDEMKKDTQLYSLPNGTGIGI